MRRLATLAAASLVSGLSLAVASLAVAAPAPQVPPSEQPGRERERFIDPFPKPPGAGSTVTPPRTVKPRTKPKCRDGRRPREGKC